MTRESSYFETYVSGLDPDVRRRMTDLRQAIVAECPSAGEGAAYRMPSFSYRGKPLVYIAAAKRHIGVYPTADAVEVEAPELAAYRSGKGTLQFPHNRDFPMDLIRRLVRVRCSHIDAQFQ